MRCSYFRFCQNPATSLRVPKPVHRIRWNTTRSWFYHWSENVARFSISISLCYVDSRLMSKMHTNVEVATDESTQLIIHINLLVAWGRWIFAAECGKWTASFAECTLFLIRLYLCVERATSQVIKRLSKPHRSRHVARDWWLVESNLVWTN